MTGPAAAAVRRAVREFLREAGGAARVGDGLFVAVSGGADSLALTDGAVHAGHRLGVRVTALVVDHGLQPGSAKIADAAAEHALRLGADAADVVGVTVSGPGGPEAAARRARYVALRERIPSGEGALVLLGHTLDDQAETVLLGLGRGSGPRSIAGMRPLQPPWGRPLLGLRRAVTRDACAELGVEPWSDPHNSDPRFRRVRLRSEALPLLEDVLGGGVAGALARTAAQLREDSEALDLLAGELFDRARVGAEQGDLDAAVLATAPASLRRRVVRRWLLDGGVSEVTDGHLRSVDALVGRWRGQGAVWLPGNFEAGRSHGKLWLTSGEPGGTHAPTTRGD